MNKAIVSAAGPSMAEVLAASEPTFQRFAEEHDYSLVIHRLETDNDGFFHPDSKAARWGKIALIEEALKENELVVWMDADAMFLQFDRDIVADVPPDCFQAFVCEQAGGMGSSYRSGFNPNTGVWPIRQSPESTGFLEKVKSIGQLAAINGTDQEAVCTALGWSITQTKEQYTIKPTNYSPFLEGTGWLPPEWNPLGIAGMLPGRVLHCAGMRNDTRAVKMHQQLSELKSKGLV